MTDRRAFVFLAAANVRFAHQRRKARVEKRRIEGAKGVRKRGGTVLHDLEEVGVVDAPREIEVPFQPRTAWHRGGESHAGEKHDARFLRNDLYRAARFDERTQAIEGGADRSRLATEMIAEAITSAGVRHVASHEASAALRALPEFRSDI